MVATDRAYGVDDRYSADVEERRVVIPVCPFPSQDILDVSELPNRADAIEVMARAIHTHYCLRPHYDICESQMIQHRKDAEVALESIWTETILS